MVLLLLKCTTVVVVAVRSVVLNVPAHPAVLASNPVCFLHCVTAASVHVVWFQGLQPERKYEVRVQAVNAVGVGPHSDVSDPIWTLGRPSVAPTPVRGTLAHVNGVEVAWEDAATEVCVCLCVSVCV